MEQRKNFTRYPFVIADEYGYVLLASPYGVCLGEKLLTSENLSRNDIVLVQKMIFEETFHRKIAVRNIKNGKTIIISLAMFPSTRTIAAIYTDIDFKLTSEICGAAFTDVAMSELPAQKMTRRHEKLYPVLSDVLYAANEMFSIIVGDKDSFRDRLFERIHLLGTLAGCKTEIDCSDIRLYFSENFDGGLFSLFLLTVLTAASAMSDERCARIYLSESTVGIKVRIEFRMPMKRRVNKAELKILDKGFNLARSHLRSVCERLNIPFSFVEDGGISATIIPIRPEVSEIGLKNPVIRLQ